jgi:Mg2+ and Co2+ transporter CorA
VEEWYMRIFGFEIIRTGKVEEIENKIDTLNNRVDRMEDTTASALELIYDKLNDMNQKQTTNTETIKNIEKTVTYTANQISYINDIIKYYPKAPHFNGKTKEEAREWLNIWAPKYQEWKHRR